MEYDSLLAHFVPITYGNEFDEYLSFHTRNVSFFHFLLLSAFRGFDYCYFTRLHVMFSTPGLGTSLYLTKHH